VQHVGCLGGDGAILEAVLTVSGVGLDAMMRQSGPSGTAMIQVAEDGENAIVIAAGSNAAVTVEAVDGVLAAAEPGDLVVMQNETPDPGAVLRRARGYGLRIAANPAPMTAAVAAWPLAELSYLVLNHDEAAALAGSDDTAVAMLDVLCARYPLVLIAVTDGAQGAHLGRGAERWHAAAPRVAALDTVAAGDTFTGYLIAGCERGDDPGAALAEAVHAAALAVTRAGAAPSIPTRDEVLAWSP
jgi:ribokinase